MKCVKEKRIDWQQWRIKRIDQNLNGNSEYITVKSYTLKLYLPIIRSYKGVNSACCEINTKGYLVKDVH